MLRYQLLISVILVSLASVAVIPAVADIMVDPDSIGATDVIQDPEDGAMPLIDPPDPLDLGGTELAIGNAAAGALAVTDGGQMTTGFAVMGRESGSNGCVVVDGSGSIWVVDSGSSYADTLQIGGAGEGSLSISAGGRVSVTGRTDLGDASGSVGAVTVTDIGSWWTCEGDLYVGNYGAGDLSIANGGSVTSQDAVYLGYGSDSEGAVSVDGTGSLWTIEGYSFHVGQSGHGSIQITHGGRVECQSADVGSSSNSEGIVNIQDAGSTWIVDGTLEMGGYRSIGTVNIENGGYVSSQTTYLGRDIDSTGTATVSGPDSTWMMNQTAYIGLSGTGTLKVLDGGKVVSSTAHIGYNSNAEGSVDIDGNNSAWTVDGDLYIGRYGIGLVEIRNGGTVDVTGNVWVGQEQMGSQVVFDNTTLHSGSLLTSASSLMGAGTIHTGGLVCDIDLSFDQSHDLQQLMILDGMPGQNIAVHLDQSLGGALGAGYSGTGSLRIADGRQVESNTGILGWHSGSTGSALVVGTDSRWTIHGNLHVGQSGTGVLTIQNKGVVDVSGTVSVDPECTQSQIILENGTLHCGSLEAAVSDLWGTGTIYTSGLVSDLHVVFDGDHGAHQQIELRDLPGQDMIVHLTQSGDGSLGAGYKDAGSLRITGTRHIQSSAGILGWHAGSTGTATVTGIGSAWSVHGSLYVGRQGEGTLSVVDKGQMTSRTTYIGYGMHAIGTATVDGVVSEWDVLGDLAIGYLGNGTLQLAGGARMSSRNATIAYQPGSTGAVVVQDAGTEWICNVDSYSRPAIAIGNMGQGTLRILDGGRVASGPATIGGYGGNSDGIGMVDVSGPGSTWAIAPGNYFSDASLLVGYGGHGTLNISGGGRVASGSAVIGGVAYGESGTGLVNVDGVGSVWTIGAFSPLDPYSQSSFTIGYSGNGTLNITHGGTVASGRVSIGNSQYGNHGVGHVSVAGSGSVWLVGGHDLYDSIQIHAGWLHISDEGMVISGSTTIRGGGSVVLEGPGSVWSIRGGLDIGDTSYGSSNASELAILSGGLVNVEDDVTIVNQLGGKNLLVFGIGGNGQGQLEMDGDLTIINGYSGLSTLRVVVEDGIVPTVGDQFTLISFDNLHGTFTNEPTTTVAGDYLLDWNIHYNPHDITLEVASSILAADFNHDDVIDIDDFSLWQTGFRTVENATHDQGDADGDGDVDGADFLVWQRGFGITENNVTCQIVPEPKTVMLALLLLLAKFKGVRSNLQFIHLLH